MSTPPGLVGRTVMTAVKRGDVVADEPCEVMACQTAGEYGGWSILVATRDGVLLVKSPADVKLVAEPDSGPYR